MLARKQFVIPIHAVQRIKRIKVGLQRGGQVPVVKRGQGLVLPDQAAGGVVKCPHDPAVDEGIQPVDAILIHGHLAHGSERIGPGRFFHRGYPHPDKLLFFRGDLDGPGGHGRAGNLPAVIGVDRLHLHAAGSQPRLGRRVSRIHGIHIVQDGAAPSSLLGSDLSFSIPGTQQKQDHQHNKQARHLPIFL